MKKILIVVAVVLVVVVVAGAVLVSNLDRIVEARKDSILAQAEKAIGRKVTGDDVSVAVWPTLGVSLTSVTLAEDPAFATEPFVRVEDLRVNVRLLPLLRKQVDVKRLVLVGATINVIRDENGALNFDSLVPAAAQEAAGGGDAPIAGATAVPFVLAVADIKDGVVHYVDRAAGIDHTIRAIDFNARGVSRDSEVTFELSAALASENEDIRISGRAGPLGATQLAGAPIDATVALGPIDAAAAVAALPPGPALERVRSWGLGTVKADMAVRGTVGAIRFEDVVAEAAVLGATESNVSARATITGINPLVELDRAAITIEADVDAGPLPLAALRAAAAPPGDAPTDVVLGGDVTAKMTLAGALGSIRVEGSVDATAASIAQGETFAKPAGVPATMKISCTVGETAIDVSRADVRLHTLEAVAKGTVVTAPGEEHVDLTLTSGDTDLSKFASLLPAATAVSPRGTFVLNATVKGSTVEGAKPAVAGTIRLKDAGATPAALPTPVTGGSATVDFTDTTVRIDDAAFTVGRSALRATYAASSLAPLEATYRVTADRVYRDDFQKPAGKPVPRPEVLDGVVAAGRLWTDPATPDLVGHQGTVSSAKGTVANLDYTNLVAKIRSEGDVIVIESYSAKTLDGAVTGSGRAAPKAVPPTFDVRTEAKQVDLARYFQYKFPEMANVIEGRIDLNVNIAGAGTTWEQIATTLKGDGGALVVRGSLLNVNLANELVASLQQIPLVPAGLGERLRAKNPRLFTGNSTAFENLDGDFTIDGGKIRTDDLFLKAADFYIKGDGWLGFDRTMDIRTRFVFSQKLSRDIIGEVPLAKYLQDSEGRIVLPLLLSGDVVKPRIVPDADAITSALQRGAVDDGKSRLGDELKGRLGDGVKDLFGGLGKKKGGTATPDTTGGKR